MPKIAVLMPVYNGERFLKEAIESILNQTFGDYVFYIHLDKSTDNSVNIIKNYWHGNNKDDRIKSWSNYTDQNLGISGSINFLIGCLESEIKYINVVDQDDISLPEKLEKTYNFLEANPDYGLVGTMYSVINESGEIICNLDCMEAKDMEIRKKFYYIGFGHGSVLFRKSVLDKAGYYDPIFDGAQDYELITRIMEISKVANLPECLWHWRRWSKNSGNRESQINLMELAKYKAYCRRMNAEFIESNFIPKKKGFLK